MTRFLVALVSALALGASAAADIILMETGSRYGERQVKWVGKVQSLSSETGLLTFVYQNGRTPVTIDLHVSRIYSITFDVQDRHDSGFPPTRRPLTEPLPTQLSARDQRVTFFNGGFVGDDIPQEVRVAPKDRDEVVLAVRGAISRLGSQAATLEAWTLNRDLAEFEMSLGTLRSWIRGR